MRLTDNPRASVIAQCFLLVSRSSSPWFHEAADQDILACPLGTPSDICNVNAPTFKLCCLDRSRLTALVTRFKTASSETIGLTISEPSAVSILSGFSSIAALWRIVSSARSRLRLSAITESHDKRAREICSEILRHRRKSCV